MAVSNSKNPSADLSARTNSSVLIKSSLNLLDKLSDGLRQLSVEQYASGYQNRRTPVGKHVRHIIEFYQEFFRHIDSNSPKPLCYDNRQRSMRLETSLQNALIEIELLQGKLRNTTSEVKELTLSTIVHPDYPVQLIRSTSQRELFYLFDHTVHHMALIRVLAEFWGVELSKNFGLAPSTALYEARINKNA